ncbi:CHAD domain-containing protein [Marilutibacter alkalisoli]|nr:CHAD domain-containing protein [Lysobacter alkalisoli]
MSNPEGNDPEHVSGRPLPGPALRRHAHTELDAAIDWLTVDDAGKRRLHRGVHQGRKALRRVRATLALGRPALGPGADMVDRELRRVVRSLGKLRDGQALVETLTRLQAGCDDPITVSHLRGVRRMASRRRRALADAALADDPGLTDRRAVLAALAGALDTLPWAAVSMEIVHTALQASATTTAKTRARVAASGRDRDWHRWRRRMRRQSQQHTILARCGIPIASGADAGTPVSGKGIIDEGRADKSDVDKSTAALLGTAQDLSLLLEHCGRSGGFGKADRHALARYAEIELAKLRERIRHRA